MDQPENESSQPVS